MSLFGSEGFIEIGMVVFEFMIQPTAKALGKRAKVNEEVLLGRTVDVEVFGMKGGSRNDDMDVRMVLDLPPPGVQDADEAKSCPTVFGGADVLEGRGTLLEKQRVENFGMKETEGSEFLRKGEGDHEVGHRQESCFLFCRPDLLVERPAAWTTAMIAAVVSVVMCFATAALIKSSP